MLNQFMHELRKPHWEAALRVLRYIKDTPSQGFLLRYENTLRLQAYCDSDWGGFPLPNSLFLGSAFALEIELFLVSQKNKPMCPNHQHKPSIEL